MSVFRSVGCSTRSWSPEVALALILIVGSGLLGRAYSNLRTTDPGFRVDGVTTFTLSLPRAKHPNALVQHALYARPIERPGSIRSRR